MHTEVLSCQRLQKQASSHENTIKNYILEGKGDLQDHTFQ